MKVSYISQNNPVFHAKIEHRSIKMTNFTDDFNFLNQMNNLYNHERVHYAKENWHTRDYFNLNIIDTIESELKNLSDKSIFTIMQIPNTSQKLILKNGKPAAGPFNFIPEKDNLDFFAQYLVEEYPQKLMDIAMKNNWMQRFFGKPSSHHEWKRAGKIVFNNMYGKTWDYIVDNNKNVLKPF